MNSEITTLIDGIIRKRKSSASGPKQVIENLQNLEAKIKQLQGLKEEIFNSPGMTPQQINKIDIQAILNTIAQERRVWEILWKRLNRETINIGVVGLARQGKSTFLQKVAALTDDEIPSSDRLPCTSVQSNIYHSNQKTYARVHFHSEGSFLQEVIIPYYEKLGFSNGPRSIAEFGNSPLPSQPRNPRHPARAEAIYKHLRDDYQAHFPEYVDLLKVEKQTIEIAKDKIKQYVSQDYDYRGNPRFFNHLAVEKVEIFCPFSKMEVEKIALVDMPGLGDTRLGDAERMIKALAQDVDFILFIRRPDKNGDLWGSRDVELYDVASQALKDKLPLGEWSFMLLNQDGENEQQCQDLENTRASKGIHVKKCLKSNCKNSEAANEVLKEVLDYLTQNMDRLDRQYMSAASQSLSQLRDWVNIQLQDVRQAIAGYGDINAEYVKLKEQLLLQLYKSVEEFREKVRGQFEQPNEEFKAQVDAAINQCKLNPSIPNSELLKTWGKKEGIDKAYFKAIQQMRPGILKHFHSMENSLKGSLAKIKSEVANLLIELGIGGAIEEQGAEFLPAMAETLSKTNNLPNLAFGFQFITSFEVMYKGVIQSIVWQKISEVLPPNPMVPVKTPDTIDPIVTKLQQRHQEAIDVCQKALEGLALSVNRGQISMVEEFADYITRAEGVEAEWDIFLSKNRSQIWSELEDMEEQQQLQKQWLALVREILIANGKLLMT